MINIFLSSLTVHLWIWKKSSSSAWKQW